MTMRLGIALAVLIALGGDSMNLRQAERGLGIAVNVVALIAYVKGLFGKKKVKDDRANSK